MSDNNGRPNICRCGRSNDRIHCSKCGSFYTVVTAKKSQRYNPEENRVCEYVLFKCRKCGNLFDDVDKRDCKAIPLSQTAEAISEEIVKKQLIERVKRGDVFSENEKRNFKRLVGSSVDEIKDLYARAQRIAAHNAATPKTEAQIQETKRQQTAITTLNDHYADCAICMRALTEDKEDSICEDGKKLKLDCVRKDI